jgi:hypothetical protein
MQEFIVLFTPVVIDTVLAAGRNESVSLIKV